MAEADPAAEEVPVAVASEADPAVVEVRPGAGRIEFLLTLFSC